MRPKYIPPEFKTTIGEDDIPVIVRYDANPGEPQWFDPRAGVGHPGEPASIVITEIKLPGEDWRDDLLSIATEKELQAIEEEIDAYLCEQQQDLRE